jgi:outer membrane protein
MLLGLALTCAAAGMPAHADSLIDIYRLAQQNDPRYLAAQSSYFAALEIVPQARGALFPSVNATADATRNKVETRTDSPAVARPSGSVDFDSTGWSLTLTQPLFNAGLSAGLRQAKAQELRAEFDFAAAKQDLIVRSVDVYFLNLAAQDSLDLATAEKRAIARQLELAQARLEVGLATITDVHDARARFQLAAAQEIEARNILADQREGLRELVGRYIEQLARLSEAMPLVSPDPPNVEPWLEQARQANLALLSRRQAAEIAREDIRLQRAGHFPSLDIVGERTDNNDDSSLSRTGVRTDSTEIGVQLNIPLYQGGIVSSRTTQAVHQLDVAERDVETELRATERLTRSAYNNVSSSAARIEALHQAVIASESAVEARTEGYQAGINTNIDVLDAQRDLFRAQRDYLRSRYDYVLNFLRLKQAAGNLSENDLIAGSRWLE